ncbi:multidrug effflux MFS transporter [Caldimonas thermodepolymerans]|jgi:drug resistance transporter, Bcr/CflA subfamily|uniref:Bcr/CflA family efflux transporter n=1 Tax=Caldimonas thermodepolymerans TaxID=215580 RepID=A0A2S5T8F3_9BURK|nr:multidrug effflux MFS transporter [Caldimonas thermodepolymerans]PPE71251.1 Bcr/CflA family drug resistance efflux transporter [Caldimonas thermodepolymerans]QPC32426.1 multidrug effflux MFS transporter [Caldimonas thermodepolymerans]RDH98812.1 DHA1 family bicyclomycin/chloramphenicol resistance-like MFS transporter [Caldimonas thermodepolymerans]TCP06210.1 DHA1 family bicyclomycin/chloramphenicol resistance-like MFS transporter [Caldimonas thermodepolymerans]UZG45221.1 multidrug effflux MF
MTHPTTAIPQAGAGRLILVLAMLTAFAPFSTDMYLPAFAQLAAAYRTDHGHIEATLSTFFLGLACGQALYGPVIDRYGRKGPMLAGVLLFALATLGCLLTRDIALFTGLRFVQAIGGCAGMIIGRAVVHDLYGPRDSARVLSLLLTLVTLAPIVAPLLGGWILAVSDWRAIFVLLLAFAALCAILVALWVPETLPRERRRPLDGASILAGYATLLRSPRFMVPALAGGIAGASMFAFITGSPFVFMGHFGLSEQQYGWVFGGTALGLVAGAQLNGIALRRFGVARLLGLALGVNLAAAVALLAVAQTPHPLVLMLPLWFVIATLGLVAGNSAAIAMAASGAYPGTASALVGILQFGCAFAVSSAVAAAQNGTTWPMVLAMLASAVLGSALWFGGQAWRAARAD